MCAKKNNVLYLRKGVSYDRPLGASWVKGFCDVRDLAVGSDYVARCTSQGDIFAVKFASIELSSSVFLANWSAVPRCEEVGTPRLFTLDSRDTLYLFSPAGEAFACPLPRPSDDYKWVKIAGAPPIKKRRSGLLGYLGWGGGEGVSGGVFSGVSGGDGCVWCVGDGGRELQQLVLCFPGNNRDKIEGSWKTFQMPACEDVTLLASDKREIDVVYASVRENRSIVSYAVLQDDCGRVEILNPENLDQRWRSLSICAISKPKPEPLADTEESKPPVPSIYPKLPRSEGFDLCCEDGSCSYCQRTTAGTIRLQRNTQLSPSEEEEGEEGGVVIGNRRAKRRELVPKAKTMKVAKQEEGVGRGRKRKKEEEEEGGSEGGSKKVKVQQCTPMQRLVADIPVRIVGTGLNVQIPPPLEVGTLMHTHVHTHVHTHMYVHTCTHTRTHTHTHTHTHTQTHTHTHTHTHIHTHNTQDTNCKSMPS